MEQDLDSEKSHGSKITEVFDTEWRIYKKLVDNNYLFHSEVYACLHEILMGMEFRFSFLDIACGDASASVNALRGTQVSHYTGIDTSEVALTLAAEALVGLGCEVELRNSDYVAALRYWNKPIEIAWIGLSLHHLPADGKRQTMRRIRQRMVPRGFLAVYENASPDGETREGWMRRWDAQKSRWDAYTPDEWTTMTSHVHDFDFPETRSGWHRLGVEAGFDRVDEVFVSPTDLFRLFVFRPDSSAV